jgi:ferredoxin, 2Fe-2S
MTLVTVLPHPENCPEGASIDVKPGKVLCDALLAGGIELEHACDGVCACSTCHVIIKEGLSTLAPATEEEEDQLDEAWGVTAKSRLACQVKVGTAPITIELPRYSLNHAREHD